MGSIERLADEIIAREGGYVNDPDDPGGATNMGVTLATLRKLERDLNGDGHVTISDLHLLTPEMVRDIFIETYFRAPRIDSLPKVLWASMFDMSVNAGAQSVRILQRLLGDFGIELKIDGVIGPKTRDGAQAAYEKAPDHIADAYGIARRNYYYALADRRPASRKFARRRDGGKGGWITRAEDFIAPRYHLSDDEHRARTAKWA